MPNKKLFNIKIQENLPQYLNDIGATPVGNLSCNFCDLFVKYDKNLIKTRVI